MTTWPKTFLHAACIALLLMLLPNTARPQEQKEPAGVQPAKAAEEPAVQKSGSLVPPDQGKSEQETATPKPGNVASPPEKLAETETAPASMDTTPYIIKRGDTLWDIAHTFMKDPFLWPFIWKANPTISNPDLIYPGSTLAIPNLAPIERALKAPPTAEPTEQLVEKQAIAPGPAPKEREEELVPPPGLRPREGIAGARATKPKPIQPETGEETRAEGGLLTIPEEQPVPIIDKYAMLSAGFVNQEETDDTIVGSPEEAKTIFSYDELVYVKIHGGQNINIGDKFLIYAPLNKVKHPKTGTRYGRLIRGLGILQITAKDAPDVFTAKITLSFDAIEKNSMLTPYQEPTLVYNSTEKKAKDISGYILEVTDRRTINAQSDFVYLDKGSADGVDAGDRFNVYADADKKDRSFPRKKIGEVQVILAKEHTATAVVRKSTDTMAVGDRVDFMK